MNESDKHSESTHNVAKQPSRLGMTPLFETGPVFIDRRVLDKFDLDPLDAFLASHVACDAGPCSDWQHIYEICLLDGGPVFSFFRNEAGDEGCIVTDPDRSKTTITLRITN